MKIFLIVLLCITMSCSQKAAERIVVHDTVRIEIPCDYDSIKATNDTLEKKLLLSDFKLEKVKFYTNLVDRKPSQIKFLKGWIKRAIE